MGAGIWFSSEVTFEPQNLASTQLVDTKVGGGGGGGGAAGGGVHGVASACAHCAAYTAPVAPHSLPARADAQQRGVHGQRLLLHGL